MTERTAGSITFLAPGHYPLPRRSACNSSAGNLPDARHDPREDGVQHAPFLYAYADCCGRNLRGPQPDVGSADMREEVLTTDLMLLCRGASAPARPAAWRTDGSSTSTS